MTKPQPRTRAEKAQQLFDKGVRPQQTGPDCWTVEGSAVYEVRRDSGEFSCSCMDFSMHGGLDCKHILLVELCYPAAAAAPKNTCNTCLEARHGGPAEFSAGQHLWCSHKRVLVEAEKAACEWFLSRNTLVVV